MRTLIHHIPIITTLLAILFSRVLFRRWRRKPSATYLAWWTAGVLLFGVGTLTESLTTLNGWNEWVFRFWYISGALLGGAPLAQGTAYLLMSRRWARRTSVALITVISVAAIFVLLTPINREAVETYRLSGKVMAWQWVRVFSPFINLYSLLLLAGGAVWSARLYWKRSHELGARVIGNVAIAIGALLPGIGGSFTRFGKVEVLYVTELIGLIFIWVGYRVMASDSLDSVHLAQRLAGGLAEAEEKR